MLDIRDGLHSTECRPFSNANIFVLDQNKPEFKTYLNLQPVTY